MTGKEIKMGDKISWNSTQGTVTGTVKKKMTAPMDIKTHHVAASVEDRRVQGRGLQNQRRQRINGHRSGKKIVALLGRIQAEFTSSDIAHAQKVVGYVHRHLAQRPAGDVSRTHWRYSLMNWGNDPQ